MNRYSNLELSTYTPRSLQETLMVPVMRRQQHDAAANQLDAKISELDKINPLSQHFEEAQRLKKELKSTIESQANRLATEGFNTNTTSNIMQTNRGVSDMFSATGRIGKINSAKAQYDKEKETYLEDAVKISKIGREQALKNWEKHSKDNYTGYTNDGKDISVISGLGAPSFQDYEKDRADYHNLLGKTTSSAKASGFKIVPSGLATGEMMMVDQKGNRVTSDNLNQLNAAKLGMMNKWVSENGEGRRWANAAGWDPTSTANRINLDFGAMRERSDVDNTYTDHSVISGTGNKAVKTPDVETPTGTPYETKEVGAKDSDYNDILKIGSKNNGFERAVTSGSTARFGEGTVTPPKHFTHNDIADPLMKARYLATFDKLYKSGKIQHKVDNPYSAKLVLAEMKKDGPITLSSNVIRTDAELNSLGFANKLVAKDAKGRDAQVVRELQQSLRKLIDPETGKPTTYNEMVKKGYQMGKTQYFGYMSPHNWTESNFKSGDMAPHIITIYDKDGNAYPSQMSKIAGDETPKEKRAGKVLNETYRAATVSPNSEVKIKSDSPIFKDVTVSYNTRSKTGQQISEPYWTVNVPGEGKRDLTESEYIKFMNINIE